MSSTIQNLIRTNVVSLRQALDLLVRVDDHTFSTSPPGHAPHKAGSHLRHILEFYECLLDGLAKGASIDYDARKRDLSIEVSSAAAAVRIAGVIEKLQAVPAVDRRLFVRPEDTCESGLLPSSLSRELMSLSSHTIHHFALIAVTLQAHGVAIDPHFGVAPSTLRYQECRKIAEAA